MNCCEESGPGGRREFLGRTGLGLGLLGLRSLLAEEDGRGLQAAVPVGGGLNPLALRPPHAAATAKRVIHIFLNGGPSHVDTFDHKPLLKRYIGRTLPVPNLQTESPTEFSFPSPFTFRRYGESGIEVSDLFRHVGESIDDICVIRSMYADVPNHEPSLMLLNCGTANQFRPSMGAWLTYGLGSECQDLPGFIAMCPGGYPIKGTDNWRSAFLPGIFQGTHVDPAGRDPRRLIDFTRNSRLDRGGQRRLLDLLRAMNSRHRSQRTSDPRLEARVQSFEQAFRMQTAAADAFDVSDEPRHIQEMYGEGVQSRQLLIARRLSERGVRFVQVWHGEGQPWDSHANIRREHKRLAGQCSQAIGALLKDLKQRGLLEETLVLWGGEFGRTPTAQDGTGRDHNHHGFTVWLAGGGVRGGTVYGATDELGWKAAKNPVHVHDLQATMLHLMGLDHERLTYRYAGRDFRLTDVGGRVIPEIIA